MENLVALKKFPYAGKKLLPGSEFTASAKEAKLLVAIKKAAYACDKTPHVEEKKTVRQPRASKRQDGENDTVPAAPKRRRNSRASSSDEGDLMQNAVAGVEKATENAEIL